MILQIISSKADIKINFEVLKYERRVVIEQELKEPGAPGAPRLGYMSPASLGCGELVNCWL